LLECIGLCNHLDDFGLEFLLSSSEPRTGFITEGTTLDENLKCRFCVSDFPYSSNVFSCTNEECGHEDLFVKRWILLEQGDVEVS
jgi:hypothetical protein